jgi:cytochrome c553
MKFVLLLTAVAMCAVGGLASAQNEAAKSAPNAAPVAGQTQSAPAPKAGGTAEEAAKPADSETAKPDLAKAQQIVNQVCAACHGGNGNSPSAVNPSLAGQPAEYITLQLAHFKAGVRVNPIMTAMAAPLSPDDMRSLGAYFSQQAPRITGAKSAELASTGQKLFRGGNAANGVPACAACHSPNGAGIPARYPRLGGQHADYTLAQLKAFKAGDRGMDKEGKDANGRIMAQIAGRMSEADMRAVAEYTAGLR